MNLHLSAQHITVTDAIYDYAIERIEKLKKHFDHVVDIHINIKIENHQHFAEGTIHLKNNTIFATALSDDMYTTIDKLVHKLDRQIIKHKEKVTDHHSKSMSHHNIKE